MSERHRHRTGPVAVDDGEIRVAKTRRRDLDQHLIGSGRCKIDLFDVQGTRFGVRQRRTHCLQNSCLDFHCATSLMRFLSSSTSTRLFSE
ncbi:hypothetical protein AWB68_07732 [Caballeronia choica]|uniref:Uncharacterized protein n=1 Tax=Caballeronia choica TaxID=326476 RepID=A0A158KYV1_9BURK|nr:hypothetical protein AWB68_07732 [Caballeronia choica]